VSAVKVGRLVEYFRGEGARFGNEGDLQGWSTEETAVRFLRSYRELLDQAPRPIGAELPWRCFHCEEVFDTRAKAAEHFGTGNYKNEQPVCIEAATTELKMLVITNRELWERLRSVEQDLEQAEFERDNFAYAARKLTGKPSATAHDLSSWKETADGRVLAAEAAIDAAPAWLAAWLRRRAERIWRRAPAAATRAQLRQILQRWQAWCADGELRGQHVFASEGAIALRAVTAEALAPTASRAPRSCKSLLDSFGAGRLRRPSAKG
jgi:hypothetical protein